MVAVEVPVKALSDSSSPAMEIAESQRKTLSGHHNIDVEAIPDIGSQVRETVSPRSGTLNGYTEHSCQGSVRY